MASKITRRQFVGYGGTAALGLYLASRTRFLGTDPAVAAQVQQMALPGSAIPQFVEQVPNLLDSDHLIVDGGTQIALEMREHQVNILPAAAVPGGAYAGTYVWSYLKPGQTGRTSYLGPVVVAQRGNPTEMMFVNMLGDSQTTKVDAYRTSTDQTLHWADPLNDGMNMWNHMAMPPAFGSEGAANYAGPIPACVHLHGGEVPPELDGGPDAWFTSDGSHVGSGFYSRDGAALKNYSIYRYPNSQEGALIWFHDHTLGATRLNVYAGLAGAYLLTDPDNDPQNLPSLFPLVIQDKMFDQTGQLFFPADSSGGVLWALNPEHPYWVPEFVGDTILVNGKSWPFMNAEAKRYTFPLINGSNARTYELSLVDPISKNFGPPLWVIGTDGGYLDKPVKIDPAAKGNNKLVIMPGERYWVIVDFAACAPGTIGLNGAAYSGTWDLKNTAKTPFPGGATPTGGVGKIMRFVVGPATQADTSYNPASGASLRKPMVRLSPVAGMTKRQLTLNEVMAMPRTTTDPATGATVAYPGGPLEILVNNTKWDGQQITGVDGEGMYTFTSRQDFAADGVSELPREGTTEQWEIINLTADAHPIHLHLVQFQLVNRQNFDVGKYNAAYALAFKGGGWDTMAAPPGPYPAGVYVPGYGPPLDYKTGNPAALGGNPDVNAVNAKKQSLYLQGQPQAALPQESGWKDTVVMYPGQVTRILVRWAPTDLPASTPADQAGFPFDPSGGGVAGYVWHCHIVDHEDNEMMRPDRVMANGGVTRSYVKGTDY